MALLLHSLQHASEGDVVDFATHVVDSVLQWLVLLALFRAHAATGSNIRAAPRFLAVVVAWSQGLVPDASGMAAEIVGLSIEVVGHRPVEPPGGHSYANSLGKAVTKDLSKAGDISVTPIFAGGVYGTAIPMSYCGRGQSRDVWEGADRQLGGMLPLRFAACTGACPRCLCATLDKTRLIWHSGSDVAYLLASRMSAEQPLLCAVGHFRLGHLRVPAFQGGSSRP